MQRKWESERALFILSILFDISEIADIMGNLTDGMRSHRHYELENSPGAVRCSIGEVSCFREKMAALQTFFKQNKIPVSRKESYLH